VYGLKATSNDEEIKFVAFELCLAEGITRQSGCIRGEVAGY